MGDETATTRLATSDAGVGHPCSALTALAWRVARCCRFASHFDPYSPIFKGKRERVEVVVSDLALAAVLSGLGWLGTSFGWLWLVKMYVVPYLIVNHW